MSIFTIIHGPAKMMLWKPLPPFCIPGWMGNIKINKYAKFDSNCSAKSYFSKMGGLVCKWFGNVDMHMYANCDKNIPCGTRFMNVFTNWISNRWTDSQADRLTYGL